MPSKDISYQVALKLSFCSAATLSEVLGMWPRPFRKLLGREHLSPGITTFPQKAGSHFAHQKMQGFDRRKYHGWWVKHFLVGVQCDYGNGNLYSAFYWMLKPLSKSSYSLLLEHVSAQRSWDLTEALSLSLCKSLSFGETVEVAPAGNIFFETLASYTWLHWNSCRDPIQNGFWKHLWWNLTTANSYSPSDIQYTLHGPSQPYTKVWVATLVLVLFAISIITETCKFVQRICALEWTSELDTPQVPLDDSRRLTFRGLGFGSIWPDAGKKGWWDSQVETPKRYNEKEPFGSHGSCPCISRKMLRLLRKATYNCCTSLGGMSAYFHNCKMQVTRVKFAWNKSLTANFCATKNGSWSNCQGWDALVGSPFDLGVQPHAARHY